MPEILVPEVVTTGATFPFPKSPPISAIKEIEVSLIFSNHAPLIETVFSKYFLPLEKLSLSPNPCKEITAIAVLKILLSQDPSLNDWVSTNSCKKLFSPKVLPKIALYKLSFCKLLCKYVLTPISSNFSLPKISFIAKAA